MRHATAVLIWALGCLLAAPTFAEPVSASAEGSVGVGTFDARALATLDAGVDLQTRRFQLGLGARFRFVGDDGLRDQDWDELSEVVGIVQHASYVYQTRKEGDFSFALKLGALSDVSLGNGSLLAGYAGNLNVDHRHLGFHGWTAGQGTTFEAMVDNITDPQLVGTRIGWSPQDKVMVGGTFLTDWSAPSEQGSSAATALGVDVAWDFVHTEHGFSHTLHSDINALLGMGVGTHAGYSALYKYDGDPRFRTTVEARLGSSGYLPNYFSPLYTLTRTNFNLENDMMADSQFDAVDQGGFGGLGAKFQVWGMRPDIGEGELTYERRAGGRDLAHARFLLPSFAAFQAGGWLALERAEDARGRSFTGAAALEGRVQLPHSLYLRSEVARLYQSDSEQGVTPLWIASLAVGAVLGN